MRKIYFVCFLFMLNGLFAQKKEKLNPIAVYEKVWQEKNSDVRLKLIKSVWLDDSTFEDPSASIKGQTALNNVITEFYKKFPDAVLTSGSKITKDNYVTWEWKIMDSKKNELIMGGRDFARLNGKGQVSKIIGFGIQMLPCRMLKFCKIWKPLILKLWHNIMSVCLKTETL